MGDVKSIDCSGSSVENTVWFSKVSWLVSSLFLIVVGKISLSSSYVHVFG